MQIQYMTGMLNMGELEDFLAVVDQGSILRAAEVRQVSQPMLSRRLRALERSLGVELFTRSARGATPTVHGELLEEHARLILGDRRRAMHALRCLRDGIVGHARVGVAPAFSSILPRAIARLTAQRPGLTFSATYGTFDSLVHAVRVGEIDAAFSLLPGDVADEGLTVRRLLRHRVEVICSPTHRLRRRRKLSVAELERERWALIDKPRSVLDAFRRIAADAGLASPVVTVETDSLDLVKSMVMDGACLSVLPHGAVAGDLEAGRMSTLKVEGLPEVDAGVIYPAELLSPAIQLLVEEIATERGST